MESARPADIEAMKPLLPLLAGAAVLASSCSAPALRITPRYGTFDVSGNFGIQAGDVDDVPTSDLKTAGISKDDGYFGLKSEFDFGPTTLTLTTQATDHGGSGVLESKLSSGEDTIPEDTDVDSDVRFGLHQFVATFDLVPGDTLDVGLGLGVTVADLDAELTDGVETLSAKRTLPIPVVALRGRTVLGRFEAGAMVSGMALEFDGDELAFLDYELEARWRLFGGEERLAGAIGAGYRGVNLTVDYLDAEDSVDADLRFQGPFLEFTLSF